MSRRGGTGTGNVFILSIAFLLLAGPVMGCAEEADDEPALDEAEGSSGARNPVIWVHGCPPPFATHEQVSHFTDGQRAFFQSQGYPADRLFRFVFSGAQCSSNFAYAVELASLVSRVRTMTGASKVDIVAHSMGSLAARVYLAFGGFRNVAHFVSIAGGNHGSFRAEAGVPLQDMLGFPAYEGMQEMFPPYACFGQTSGGAFDVQGLLNGCLTPSGRSLFVDETPDSSRVKYLSIHNTFDEEIVPHESGCLNQRFQNDCSDPLNLEVAVPPGPGPCGPDGCPAHVTILFDPDVTQVVFDHITDQ